MYYGNIDPLWPFMTPAHLIGHKREGWGHIILSSKSCDSAHQVTWGNVLGNLLPWHDDPKLSRSKWAHKISRQWMDLGIGPSSVVIIDSSPSPLKGRRGSMYNKYARFLQASLSIKIFFATFGGLKLYLVYYLVLRKKSKHIHMWHWWSKCKACICIQGHSSIWT